jgi:hypothetical protein
MPMRQRSAALLIIGIGLLIAGCGDDTSPSVMATDSGVDSSLVLVMDGSAPNEASTSNEASSSGPDCGTSVGVNVATVDAGIPLWTCLEQVCNPQLTACSADTCCDNAVVTALACTADAGLAGANDCFNSEVGIYMGSDTTVAALGACLGSLEAMCLDQGGEAGADAAADSSADAHAEAMATDAASDSGGDGASGDATTASDAGADGSGLSDAADGG